MRGAAHDPFGSKEPIRHASRLFDTAPLFELMFPELAFELEAMTAKAMTAKAMTAKAMTAKAMTAKELHERFPSCCLAWPVVRTRVT
jgi:hypothetical protein